MGDAQDRLALRVPGVMAGDKWVWQVVRHEEAILEPHAMPDQPEPPAYRIPVDLISHFPQWSWRPVPTAESIVELGFADTIEQAAIDGAKVLERLLTADPKVS